MLDALGGSGQVVKFRREGEMPGYVPHSSAEPTRKIVFHIACSRNRIDGEPTQGLAPLQTRWLGSKGEAYGVFPNEWASLLSSPLEEEPAETPEPSARVAPVGGYRVPLVTACRSLMRTTTAIRSSCWR